MAIKKEQEVIVANSGKTYGKLGISNSLSSYSADEIKDYLYCSCDSYNWTISKTAENTPAMYTDGVVEPLTFLERKQQGSYNANTAYYLGSGASDHIEPLYHGIIWLYSTSLFQNYYLNNANNVSIVTNFENDKMFYMPGGFSMGAWSTFGNTYGYPSGWNDTDGMKVWAPIPYFYYCYKEASDKSAYPNTTDICQLNVRPYAVIEHGGKIAIIDATIYNLLTDNYLEPHWNWDGHPKNGLHPAGFKTFDGEVDFGFVTPMVISETSGNVMDPGYRYGSYIYGYDYSGKLKMYGSCLNEEPKDYFVGPNDKDSLDEWIARWGVYFYTDTMYKPIISGGYVTGYTTDLGAPSELDDFGYTDGNKHDVSPTRPTKPTGGDEIDPMDFGAGSNFGGMLRYWHLSPTQLSDLWTAINNDAPWGFSIDASFVCVYGLCNNALNFVSQTSQPFLIQFKKSDGSWWSTGVSAPYITGQKSIINVCTMNVQRRWNNFLDYPPYSNYEIFLPLCGWSSLPASCIGKTVQISYVFDITLCTCKALVTLNGMTVVEKQGTIGVSVPFTNINTGLQSGAVIGALGSLASSALMTGVGAVSGNPAVALGGATGLFGSASQMINAGSRNFTTVDGGFGDRTQFANGTKPYIKITSPEFEIPEGYGHTIGFLVNKAMKMSECSGFTIVSDAKIGNNGTDIEKEELKTLLESGVII